MNYVGTKRQLFVLLEINETGCIICGVSKISFKNSNTRINLSTIDWKLGK
jgi:hypothetical protein